MIPSVSLNATAYTPVKMTFHPLPTCVLKSRSTVMVSQKQWRCTCTRQCFHALSRLSFFPPRPFRGLGLVGNSTIKDATQCIGEQTTSPFFLRLRCFVVTMTVLGPYHTMRGAENPKSTQGDDRILRVYTVTFMRECVSRGCLWRWRYLSVKQLIVGCHQRHYHASA